MSNVKYASGNWTEARQVGAMRHESPLLPFSNEVLLFHQEVVQRGDLFEALDYNTISPDITGAHAFLVNESPREDFGGNRLRWTRSWARVPSAYDMPGGTYQYKFPGYADGRDPLVIGASLTIHREFFLCGNHGTDNGGYDQWQDIPVNRAFVIENTDPDFPDELDDTTTPTLAAYQAMVAANTPIQIEDSKITAIFGSIFVRDDFFVTAR